MKAQADALEELEKVKAELGHYERTYGPVSENSPEVSELLEQLRLKEDELEKLRLCEIQRQEVGILSIFLSQMGYNLVASQNESSIFAELQQLSTLWETMDRQLKNQISELANMEDRVSKGAADVCIFVIQCTKLMLKSPKYFILESQIRDQVLCCYAGQGCHRKRTEKSCENY